MNVHYMLISSLFEYDNYSGNRGPLYWKQNPSILKLVQDKIRVICVSRGSLLSFSFEIP